MNPDGFWNPAMNNGTNALPLQVYRPFQFDPLHTVSSSAEELSKMLAWLGAPTEEERRRAQGILATMIARTEPTRRETDEPKVSGDTAAYLAAWYQK